MLYIHISDQLSPFVIGSTTWDVVLKQHANYWIVKSFNLLLIFKEQHIQVNVTGKH